MPDIAKLKSVLNEMCNRQFESAEFQDLLTLPWTMERGRYYVVQNALYTKNRRDCWGYVQAAAPLDVKSLVWQHESDELINDPRAGMDHYSLNVKQGEVIGLEREDFENAEPPPMTQAAFLAWHHIAVKGPWLAAFTSSQMLERRNNPDIVEGRRHVVPHRQEVRERAGHQPQADDLAGRAFHRGHRPLGHDGRRL